MLNVIIDEEFKILLPALDADTYKRLEKDIQQNGCRDPLVLWEDILIDGYNRYNICMEHDIPFETVRIEFDSREEALIWIIKNQVLRRNLTPIQLSHYRGLHYRAEKKIQGTNNQFSQKSEKSQNATFQGSTATHLSKQYRVSRDTIIRDSKLSSGVDAIGEVSLEAKRKILSGEVEINKKKLETLSSLPAEEIVAIATEIEAGTYKRRAPATQAAADGNGSGTSHAPSAPGNSDNSNPSDPGPANPSHVNPNPANPNPASPGSGGNRFDDLEPTEQRRLASAIGAATNGMNADLQRFDRGEQVDLKTTLRAHIDALEGLYRQM